MIYEAHQGWLTSDEHTLKSGEFRVMVFSLLQALFWNWLVKGVIERRVRGSHISGPSGGRKTTVLFFSCFSLLPPNGSIFISAPLSALGFCRPLIFSLFVQITSPFRKGLGFPHHLLKASFSSPWQQCVTNMDYSQAVAVNQHWTTLESLPPCFNIMMLLVVKLEKLPQKHMLE